MSQVEKITVDPGLKTEIFQEPPVKESNPMRKIITLVGFAIAIFLAFITYSLQTSLKNNEQLLAIRDLYFPILERVDSNIVRLDKIEEQFLQAVMTGEADDIDTAEDFFNNSDAVFVEMIELYPAREEVITNIRDQFKLYFDLAYRTSSAFLDDSGADMDEIAGISVQMNSTLISLRDDVRLFREESYGNFLSTLQDSQKAATLNMYMSIAVGLMNLAFMGVLVYFISNNLKMVSVIAEQNANLEKRVSDRTAELTKKTNDINAMLDHMSLGVCTVIPGNLIHHEYSRFLKVIFDNEELANENVLDALFINGDIGVDTKDQISVSLESILGEDSMVFEFNSHLLVKEMNIKTSDGKEKILQLEWSPIVNADDQVEKVLLIVQDVTEFRALESESAQQKEELEIISQLLKVPVAKFSEFAASAEIFSHNNRQIIRQNDEIDVEVVAALFRNMHTIKGNARTYEFSYVTNAAHIAEQEYDMLRKEGGVWNKELMLEQLDAVNEGIEKYIDMSENRLRRKGRASDQLTNRGSFVSNDELSELQSQLASLNEKYSDDEITKIEKILSTLGMVPLERLVSGSMDFVATLSKELEKPIPDYEISNGKIFFKVELSQAIKSSFMHIVRNSLDHGIEMPDERMSKGKPKAGKLNFDVIKSKAGMELHIRDDGRGLALHKLYEKGVKAGVIAESESPSAKEVSELIFNSGLSTADAVSEISGRGVGMDAVKTFLKEQGAEIKIQLSDPDSAIDFAAFKFVISLPEGSFRSNSLGNNF